MKINLKKKGIVLLAGGLMLLASIGATAQLSGSSADEGGSKDAPAPGVWGPNWNATLGGSLGGGNGELGADLRVGFFSGSGMVKAPPPPHVSPFDP